MKKFIIIMIALVFSTGLFAQQTKMTYNEVIQNSPYIFEGKILNYNPIDNGEGQKYVSYTIEINHILRGAGIKIGTIELVTPLPMFWHIVKLPDGSSSILINQPEHFDENEITKIEFSVGMSGIFFCKQLDAYPIFSQTNLSNKLSVQNYCEDKACFLQYKQISNVNTKAKQVEYSIKAEFFNKKFDSKEDVYQFLKNYSNLSLPTIKKKDASGSLDVENKKKYAQNLNNYEKYMQQVQVKVASTANKSNACKEFFISEYADGPQKNKVIEIYNPSDSIKSLNGYSIKIFNNGAPTPLDIPLSGNVNPKETYVVTHPQADPQILAKAHQTDVKMNFDGNDAIVLNKGTSTYIDKIGEIGVNPGQAGWNVPPGASTKSQDLRRKHPIDKGETDWNQGKNQWDAFPQDSLGNIKQHQNICSIINV